MSHKRLRTLPRTENGQHNTAQTAAAETVRDSTRVAQTVTCSRKQEDGKTGYAWETALVGTGPTTGDLP